MKKDLDSIFKKIRNIKSRIGVQYPQAMKKVEQKFKNSLSEESKDDETASNSNTNEPQCSKTSFETEKKVKDPKHTDQRKLSKECVTVNYVQMETSTENGVSGNSDEKADGKNDAKTDNESTDNESSDCTSDT